MLAFARAVIFSMTFAINVTMLFPPPAIAHEKIGAVDPSLRANATIGRRQVSPGA
jgi:hypothetical protein